MQILAGTSGFSYKEWKGAFYPEDIAAADMLAFYASKLPAVEINNTFYRLPKESVLEGWAAAVPESFRFSIKASRRITHIKRLKDPADEMAYLQRTVRVLGERLGVVLFQCPPNLKADLDRLRAFLDLLEPGIRAVFEFRHESWLEDATRDVLRERGCALCLADNDDEPEPELFATADFGYLRLRRADYDAVALDRWAQRVKAQPWNDAFVFFKHEDEAGGPRMAAEFLGAC